MDPEFKSLSGNEEKCIGFEPIAFMTDDVIKAVGELEAKGIKFKKKPDEGFAQGIGFAFDPDGYLIELLQKDGFGEENKPYYKL